MRKLTLRLPRIFTAILLPAALATSAYAHPMGNFTVNHYSALTLAPDALRLHYVLDMAELPTISERQAMDTDDDSNISEAEINAYLQKRAPEWISRLIATSDGKPLAWTTLRKRLEFTAGVASLATLRIEVDARAPLSPGRHAIAFEDANYGQRVGWKEIVLDTEKGIARPAGTEALKDVSRAMRAYPEAMLNAPLQVSKAAFTVDMPTPTPAPANAVSKSVKPAAMPAVDPAVQPAAAPPTAPAKPIEASAPTGAGVPPVPAVKPKPAPTPEPARAGDDAAKPSMGEGSVPEPLFRPPPDGDAFNRAIKAEPRAPLSGSSSRWSKAFHDLVTRKALTPGALAAALLIAFFLGALHALQPGHGKTLVAAYLVGQRGTPRHAALLGLTVTVSHTFGVFALGAVALYAQRYILPQDLFPWIGFASGILIALLGVGMLYGRLKPSRDHAHDHHHPHGRDDDHHHDHEHVHAHSAAGAHGHDHVHEHTHDHPHGHGHHHGHDHAHGPLTHSHGPFGEHTHDVPDQISIKSLLALGVSGGIVPCWDALIVLLGAISLHRVAFGMLLIVAFSAGLAATLTAAGLAVVWGKDRLGATRLAPARVRAISMGSHAAIIVIGVVIAWRSLAAR